MEVVDGVPGSVPADDEDAPAEELARAGGEPGGGAAPASSSAYM